MSQGYIPQAGDFRVNALVYCYFLFAIPRPVSVCFIEVQDIIVHFLQQFSITVTQGVQINILILLDISIDIGIALFTINIPTQ